MPQRSAPRLSPLPLSSALLLVLMTTVFPVVQVVYAAPQLVTAEGEYRLGDHDTKEDAVRLAIEAAKRNALEQIATYVESVTVANGMDLTRDDVRSYTAGVVVVTQQAVTTRLEGEAIIFHAEITAQLDPDDVIQAAQALRQNDEARQQVTLLQAEVEELQQQLGKANEKLAAAMTPEQAAFASLERQELLNRVQSDDLLTRAWTSVASGPAAPSPYALGLWGQAWMLYPANPHLVVLQRVFPVSAPAVMSHMMASVPGPRSMRVLPTPPPHRASGPPLSVFRGPNRLPATPLAPVTPPAMSRSPQRVPHMRIPHHGAPRAYGGGGHGRGRR
jgi:hypothetical protein